MKNPDVAENLNLQAQSAFRTVSLARPNVLKVLEMLLKSEGYRTYSKLASLAHNFIDEFMHQKNVALYGEDAASSEYVDRSTERLVLRDIRIALRFAILLRDQEWRGYLDRVFQKQQSGWKFELQLYEPTLQEKTKELERLDAQQKWILKDKAHMEAAALYEGFRVLLRTKFFNEWRTVKQALLDKAPGSKGEQINEKEEERALEELVANVYKQVREQALAEEKQEVAAPEDTHESIEKKEEGDPLDPQARKWLENRETSKRKMKHSTTTDLALASRRQEDELEFSTHIEKVMCSVAKALALPWDHEAAEPSRQQEQCLAVIEHLRRQKALAIVGPVCTGKTHILKVVAQTLKHAYGVTFRLCRVNPQTFTKEEFYGPANAFESQNK